MATASKASAQTKAQAKPAQTQAKPATAALPKSPAPSQEVEVRKTTALAAIADDEIAADAEMDSAGTGAGLEEADRDAFAIPFLRLLQSMSPQVLSKKPEYIPGAKAGQFMQTVSKELFDELRVVPCYYSRQFIEWKPRDEGGGLVAVYDAMKGKELESAPDTTRDGGQVTLANGNVLMDTRQHYVLLIKPDGGVEQVLIALSSTGIKPSKNWNTVIRGAVVQRPDGSFVKNPDSYRSSYRVAAVEQANDKGQWFNWVFDDRQILQSTSRRDVALFHQARAFNAAMKDSSTRAKVDYEAMRESTDANQQSTPAPQDIDDNEIED